MNCFCWLFVWQNRICLSQEYCCQWFLNIEQEFHLRSQHQECCFVTQPFWLPNDYKHNCDSKTFFCFSLNYILSVKFLFIGLYELLYHAAAIYTRTVPADNPAGTGTVLRAPAISDELSLLFCSLIFLNQFFKSLDCNTNWKFCIMALRIRKP